MQQNCIAPQYVAQELLVVEGFADLEYVDVGLDAQQAIASGKLDPLRSAKRTVTCLRSPSSAALEVRIFSARCLGV